MTGSTALPLNAVVPPAIGTGLSQYGALVCDGDVTGDGHPDLAHTAGVYGGGPDLATWSTSLTSIQWRTSAAATLAGDVTGDGYPDWVSGTGEYDVFVVPGGPAFPIGSLPTTDPGVLSLRNYAGSDVGAAVAAGDLDGDGYDELILSIPDADLGGADAGQVLVLPNAR